MSAHAVIPLREILDSLGALSGADGEAWLQHVDYDVIDGVAVTLSPGWTAEQFHAVRAADAAVREAAVAWAEAMHEARQAEAVYARAREAYDRASLAAMRNPDTRHALYLARHDAGVRRDVVCGAENIAAERYTAAREALARVTP